MTGSRNENKKMCDVQKGAKIKIKREEIPLLQAIVGFPKYPGLHSQIPL